MADESYVQLAPDAGGKKVRNFLLTGVLQKDGTYADVYVQCNAVVDANGSVVSNEEHLCVLQAIRRELTLIRKGIAELNDDAALACDDDDDEDEGDG